MKKFICIIITTLITGCSNSYVSNSKADEYKAMQDKIQQQRTILIAYNIDHGIQLDDSNYINSNNLNYIKQYISCPNVSISENPYSYRANAIIDRNDMTIKIETNRKNCTIDTKEVKKYVDNAIMTNKRNEQIRFEKEKASREVDPKGPYKLGCEAFKQHIKGLSDVTKIETAIKLYPKINEIYVKNLFISGWNDASIYGARGIDCDYLSMGVN